MKKSLFSTVSKLPFRGLGIFFPMAVLFCTLLLPLLGLGSLAYAQTTYEWQGGFTDITATHFVSATEGWAVGGSGTILTTSNGGTTWTAQPSETINTFNDVYFTSATKGWAVGTNGTIRTTANGGFTWTTQTSGITSILSSVYFTSATKGWVVGNNGTIRTTSNANLVGVLPYLT